MQYKTTMLALFAGTALAAPVENTSPNTNLLTVRDANVQCSSGDGGFGRTSDLQKCLDDIVANRKSQTQIVFYL